MEIPDDEFEAITRQISRLEAEVDELHYLIIIYRAKIASLEDEIIDLNRLQTDFQ
jgi:prefoldin subunit 5